MEQRVSKVVIAGGGTAGWIAAAALSQQIGSLIEITLVESDAIGTVGVGEATIPTQRTFHRLVGIDEAEFMRATKATFKLGIAFENWARKGDRYIHSFGQVGRSAWIGDFQHMWLEARARGIAGPIGDYCYELQAAEKNRFYTSEKSPLSYAYHLDASLYAAFLRKFSEARGVKRKEGKIAHIERDGQSGNIAALALTSGARIEGDLFIDCTGFRGLLIEETLETGFEDWTSWLMTDSALAVQTKADGPPIPYTRAIAHDAGWQWRIPLQHRVGNGLVFCSQYLDEGGAHRRLDEKVSGERLTEPRLIRYTTGRRRQAWNRNCVALGLSSGFVEPLESTSIHLIQIMISRLIQLFPFAGIADALRTRFNEKCREEMEHVRDFIILHYKLTERDDSPFWRHYRDMKVPDSLAERIALFRESAMAYQAGGELFQVDSWIQVMLGQRLEPQSWHGMGRLLPPDKLEDGLARLKSGIDEAVSRMPSHQEFIERYCAAEA